MQAFQFVICFQKAVEIFQDHQLKQYHIFSNKKLKMFEKNILEGGDVVQQINEISENKRKQNREMYVTYHNYLLLS